MNTVFVLLGLGIPLAFAVMVNSKVRVLIYGTIWIWLLSVIAGQYFLATDPEYDSMAPGITLLVGWFPGLIYSLLCVLMIAVVSAFYGHFSSRSHP